MIKILGIIPARFSSKRFPGKMLAKIKGKPLIQWTWEGAKKSKLLDKLIIATDDRKIADTIKNFGGEVIMTSKKHNSGTERCWEVAKKIKPKIIINIQGDEPLINGKIIDKLILLLKNKKIDVSTLITKSKNKEEFFSPSVVKVVLDKNNFALYFSRSPLPSFSRFSGKAEKVFYKHIGIYGYKYTALKKFIKLNQSPLEKIEQLEQLRFLENGIKIKTVEIKKNLQAVDLKEDVKKVEKLLK